LQRDLFLPFIDTLKERCIAHPIGSAVDYRQLGSAQPDTGIVSQIKLQSVKLAMKYLKRVSSELEAIKGGPDEEELMLQGVRF
ncbi:hypothetical protein ACQUFG_17250, partial [Enterococcus gallinarum]|uniref:hypothetical protein n=1 Tax=Enterococcus gallinarum TaxID=1353 RepID=UPI003D0F20F0